MKNIDLQDKHTNYYNAAVRFVLDCNKDINYYQVQLMHEDCSTRVQLLQYLRLPLELYLGTIKVFEVIMIKQETRSKVESYTCQNMWDMFAEETRTRWNVFSLDLAYIKILQTSSKYMCCTEKDT